MRLRTAIDVDQLADTPAQPVEVARKQLLSGSSRSYQQDRERIGREPREPLPSGLNRGRAADQCRKLGRRSSLKRQDAAHFPSAFGSRGVVTLSAS